MDLDLPCVIFVPDVPTDGSDWSEAEQNEMRVGLERIAQQYGVGGCKLTFDGNSFAVGCDRAPLGDVCETLQNWLKKEASRVLMGRHMKTTNAGGTFTVHSMGPLPTSKK